MDTAKPDEGKKSLIEFPCHFPIKVMGVKVDGRQALAEHGLVGDAEELGLQPGAAPIAQDRLRHHLDQGRRGLGVMAAFEDRHAGVAGGATEEHGLLSLGVDLRLGGEARGDLPFADHEADVDSCDLLVRGGEHVEGEERVAHGYRAGVAIMDAGIDVERHALGGAQVEERGAMTILGFGGGAGRTAAGLLEHLGVVVLAGLAFGVPRGEVGDRHPGAHAGPGHGAERRPAGRADERDQLRRSRGQELIQSPG